MDRPIVYTGEQGRSTDFMFGQRSALVGLSKLAEAVLGTDTLISGLTVGANSPAAMNVVVQPGQIYELEMLDATAYGILPADTTHSIVKQGLLMDALTVACAAPVTSGYSINYLIQATYQDQDTTPVVLPYFNSANPSQPLSGQSNSGAAQATERQGVCVVNAKAGAAATTGTQTTPSPDSGYVGIAVVTVDYGASTIVAGNISAYAGVPRIPTTLPNAMSQAQGDARYAALLGNASQTFLVATGTAPGHAVNLGQIDARYAPIAYTQFGGTITVDTAISASDSGKFFHLASGIATLPAPADGLRFRFIGEGIASPSGSIASPASVGMGYPDGTSVVAGTIAVGKFTTVDVESAGGSWYITNTSGQVLTKAATALNHAIQLGQAFGLGQAWQDVSASRALATTYTNSTSHPIMINASISFAANTNYYWYVNGVQFGTQTASAAEYREVVFVVPPGATYSITGSSILQWAELR